MNMAIILAEPSVIALGLLGIIVLGLVLVLILGLMGVGIYNSLVTLRNRYKTPTRKLTCSSSAATT